MPMQNAVMACTCDEKFKSTLQNLDITRYSSSEKRKCKDTQIDKYMTGMDSKVYNGHGLEINSSWIHGLSSCEMSTNKCSHASSLATICCCKDATVCLSFLFSNSKFLTIVSSWSTRSQCIFNCSLISWISCALRSRARLADALFDNNLLVFFFSSSERFGSIIDSY